MRTFGNLKIVKHLSLCSCEMVCEKVVVDIQSHAEEEDGQRGEGRTCEEVRGRKSKERGGKGSERKREGGGKGREAHGESRPHQVGVEAAGQVTGTRASRSQVAPYLELTCFGEPRSCTVEQAVEWVNGKPKGKREKEWNTV